MPDAKLEMTVSPANRSDESEMGSETSVCERMSRMRETRPRVRSKVMEWCRAASAASDSVETVPDGVEVGVEAAAWDGTGLGLK